MRSLCQKVSPLLLPPQGGLQGRTSVPARRHNRPPRLAHSSWCGGGGTSRESFSKHVRVCVCVCESVCVHVARLMKEYKKGKEEGEKRKR